MQAELSLTLVDMSILALRPKYGPTLRDAFYGQRVLGVNAAESLTRSVDRLNAQLAADKRRRCVWSRASTGCGRMRRTGW